MPAPMDDASVFGKIAAVTGTEITIDPASMERPDADGRELGERKPFAEGEEPPERPADDGTERPERPDAIADGTMPEAPSGTSQEGEKRGRGGREMTYTGETVTYTLASGVSIVKGMGDDAETVSASDLAADDVVRLVMDDDGNVCEIHVMSGEFGGEPPEKLADGDAAAE